MNKFKNLLTHFWSKSFLIIALLVSFFALSKNFVTANAESEPEINVTTGVWKLKEIRVYNNMNNLGSVVRQRYGKDGGEVEINISNNGAVCPGTGGSEVARFTWRFVDDASQVRSGGGLGISLQAEQKSSSPPCTTQLSSNSYIWVKGGAVQLNSYSQSEIIRMEGDRFEDKGEGTRAYPAGNGNRTILSGVSVITRETNPDKPLTVFEIDILTTPSGHLRYAYVYELVGGSSASDPVNETNNQIPEASPTPEIYSSPSPADTENTPGPTTIGVDSNANRTNANNNTSSKGNKGGCFGLIILIAIGLLGVATTHSKRTCPN